jgi:hypothetical protein
MFGRVPLLLKQHQTQKSHRQVNARWLQAGAGAGATSPRGCLLISCRR